MAPNRRYLCSNDDLRGTNLTDHTAPHNQDNGLFRAAEPAQERLLALERAHIKLVSRPSWNLFPDAVSHEVAGHQRLTPQRDEAMMRSLRFPFDEDDR
jgi:hypothetical protein